MPPRKRTSSVLNGDAHPDAQDVAQSAAPDEALAIAEELEEAEAEAAEAEAALAVARARARAIKLRRQADTVLASGKAAASDPAVVEPADIEPADTEPADTEPADAEPAQDFEIDEPQAVEDTVADAPDTEEAPLDDESVDEPEEAEAPTRRARRGLQSVLRSALRPKVAGAALVVVLTVGLLGASAWMTFQHRQVVAEQQRTAEFAAAARQGVVTLMSLNFNSAADDVKRILDNTTGDFKKDFQGQADQFTKVAQESKVITEATVNATAVQSMTKDTATVLVAVTTQVSNVASKQQEPRSWRLRVDMARDGGQLKLAKVEFVP
jgi:Mce-associated membrane protein